MINPVTFCFWGSSNKRLRVIKLTTCTIVIFLSKRWNIFMGSINALRLTRIWQARNGLEQIALHKMWRWKQQTTQWTLVTVLIGLKETSKLIEVSFSHTAVSTCQGTLACGRKSAVRLRHRLRHSAHDRHADLGSKTTTHKLRRATDTTPWYHYLLDQGTHSSSKRCR